MKKEVGIAIVFGLIVGLIITVGMYRARTALQTSPEESPLPVVEDTSSGSAVPTQDVSSQLRVREPADEELRTSKDIMVSGTTIPSSTVIILHNEREIPSTSDAEGNFSVPDTLDIGANVFVIRVLPATGAPIEVTRTVVYESTQPDPTPTATAGAKKK